MSDDYPDLTQVVRNGVHHQLGTVIQPQFAQNITHMGADGRLLDANLPGNLAVGDCL